jgi:hypothetical protein
MISIQGFPDSWEIPDNLLDSLIDAEIECWWSEPFWEFLICESQECWKLYSIEETLWDIEQLRNFDTSKLCFNCTACHSPTKYVYPKGELFNTYKQYFNDKVSSVLLFAEKKNVVEWFGIMSLTDIEGVVNLEFNTRPWSFDKDKLSTTLTQEISPETLSVQQEVVCFHQLYISPHIRQHDVFWDTVLRLFSLKSHENTSVTLETRYDSKVYPLMRVLWFRDVFHDQYGYVVQVLEEYGKVIEFIEKLSEYDWLVSSLIKYKRHANDMLAKNPHFQDKFYDYTHG